MLCGAGFHLALNAAEPFHQELAQIPACTIRAEESEVMDMNVAALMRLADVDRIDLIQPILLRERLADIVVQSVDALLHIGVLLDLPILIVKVVSEHVDRSADKRVDLARTAAFFSI